MAAARQNEIKVSITEVATTTFVAVPGRFSVFTGMVLSARLYEQT